MIFALMMMGYTLFDPGAFTPSYWRQDPNSSKMVGLFPAYELCKQEADRLNEGRIGNVYYCVGRLPND